MSGSVTCLHCGSLVAESTRICRNCGREPLITGEADALLRQMASPAGLRTARSMARKMRRAGSARQALLDIEAHRHPHRPMGWRQRRRYERYKRKYKAAMLALGVSGDTDWH